ncbi:uncharacterized protein LOC111257700 [Setaria italica]|uniref:uncharacterized protein LOC111257700 n=1 Tax=Setaria italica TaxID=4555 RepID=UPI000BE6107B|nr:uncharacterized protein LOC111257700 [Setaria italica]
MKEAKLYVYNGKFSEFAMKKDEDASGMFNRLNDIVNELKGLGFNILNEDFSHKEAHDLAIDDGKKSMALKAQSSKENNNDEHDNNDDSNEEIALFVKSFKRIIKNKNYEHGNNDDSNEEIALFVRSFKRIIKNKNYDKKGQSSKKNLFEDKKCFECDEIGHIVMNCPNNKKKNKKGDDKEWSSILKGIADIAIKEPPSLFSTPFCLMAKGDTKVSQDDEFNNELTYDDLVRMTNDTDDYMCKEKEKLRDLKMKYQSLQVSYEELKTSHENLKETHEKLEEAHNSSLAHEVKGKVSISVGCDILNDESCAPSSSNPFCSSSDISCISDGFSCDSSLVMENEMLKKEVNCLVKDLKRCYDSKAQFKHIWTSQKFTLNNEGLDDVPK